MKIKYEIHSRSFLLLIKLYKQQQKNALRRKKLWSFFDIIKSIQRLCGSYNREYNVDYGITKKKINAREH